MSALLDKLVAQAAAQQGEPVVAGVAGVLVAWKVRHGDRVRKDDLIAEVKDRFGVENLVAAAADGILSHARHVNERVLVDDAIAYIAAPQEPVKRPAPIAAPQHTAPAPKIAPAPSGEPTAASEEARHDTPRRSTLGEEAALVEVEELALPTMPKPRPREMEERPRIVKWMWHPTNKQQSKIKERLRKLKARGFDYGIHELQRVAAEWLATVPDAELVERLEAQRDREVGERYGYGLGSSRARRTRK